VLQTHNALVLISATEGALACVTDSKSLAPQRQENHAVKCVSSSRKMPAIKAKNLPQIISPPSGLYRAEDNELSLK